MAVGWLCVSTFIRMSISSRRVAVSAVSVAPVNSRLAGQPSITADVVASRRTIRPARIALRRCCGSSPNSDCRLPSRRRRSSSALKILCRQCSRIRLREHHQLDIGRIAARCAGSFRAGSRSRPPTARGRVAHPPAPGQSRPRVERDRCASVALARACSNSAAACAPSHNADFDHAIIAGAIAICSRVVRSSACFAAEHGKQCRARGA